MLAILHDGQPAAEATDKLINCSPVGQVIRAMLRMSFSMPNTGETNRAFSNFSSAKACMENHAPMLVARRAIGPHPCRAYNSMG